MSLKICIPRQYENLIPWKLMDSLSVYYSQHSQEFINCLIVIPEVFCLPLNPVNIADEIRPIQFLNTIKNISLGCCSLFGILQQPGKTQEMVYYFMDRQQIKYTKIHQLEKIEQKQFIQQLTSRFDYSYMLNDNSIVEVGVRIFDDLRHSSKIEEDQQYSTYENIKQPKQTQIDIEKGNYNEQLKNIKNTKFYNLLVYILNYPTASPSVYKLMLQNRARQEKCYVLGLVRYDNVDTDNKNDILFDYKGNILWENDGSQFINWCVIDISQQHEYQSKLTGQG